MSQALISPCSLALLAAEAKDASTNPAGSPLAEFRDEVGVVEGPDPVSQAVGAAHGDRLPDARRAAALTRVVHQAQAGVRGRPAHAPERL